LAALSYIKCTDVPDAKRKLYYNWAKSQIDYALGNNEQKRSYVCGFGTNPPVKPHHRSMHGPYLDDNGRTPVNSRHVLYGALVGGPSQDGSYTDDRLDAVRNEVATDYNAGFSSVLAQFVNDFNCSPLPNFPQPAERDTEYTVVAKINTPGDRFSEISATVENKTTWPARYSKNLTIKYFIDPSEVLNAGYLLKDINVEKRGISAGDSGITISALKQYSPKPNLYYVEISFAGDTIFPGGQSQHRREVQFRIGLSDTFPQKLWDPSNDPSYSGLTTTIDSAGSVNIPAYEDGVMVWGKEPDGTSFKPTKWNMPVFTEPQYPISEWNRTILKGGDAVKFIDKKHTLKSPFKIIRNGNDLSISAFSDLKVGIFTLDGKNVRSYSFKRGQVSSIYLPKLSGSCTIIQINNGEEKTSLRMISY
jgi:endoglucanase